MKKICIILFASFFFLNLWIDIAKAATDYRLRPYDVLDISVWGIDELQVKGVAIREDGKVALPIIGEMQVAGLSTTELTDKMKDALDGYINHPKIIVNIAKYNTTRIYVLGEVNKPGLYDLDKQHNLLDAITMAGGYTSYAAKKRVVIISKDNRNSYVEANLYNLLKKGDMSQNFRLKDEDVVYLTSNNKLDFVKDIVPIIGGWYNIKHFNN